MNPLHSAFPVPDTGLNNAGLTKRELLAAMMMPEFLANCDYHDAAREACKAADALVTELSK